MPEKDYAPPSENQSLPSRAGNSHFDLEPQKLPSGALQSETNRKLYEFDMKIRRWMVDSADSINLRSSDERIKLQYTL